MSWSSSSRRCCAPGQENTSTPGLNMAEQDFPCYASGCSTLCKELTPLASCTSRASPGISREHSCQVSLLVLLDTLQSMKNRRDSSSQAKGTGADSPKSRKTPFTVHALML